MLLCDELKCNSSQGKWLACSELKPVVTSDEFLKKLFCCFTSCHLLISVDFKQGFV